MFLSQISELSGMSKGYWDNSSITTRIKRVYKKGGLLFLIKSGFGVLWRSVKYPFLHYWFNHISKLGVFLFNGREYAYFANIYNTTWQNERVVEIPIASRVLAEHKGERILEVGHVLGHYTEVSHDVLDKYELSEGVINEDVATFAPQEKYDFIISVSTMEHVGWDEEPRDPEKVIKSFDNLKNNCLKKGGTIMVTIPVDWNPSLDDHVRSGRIKFDEIYYLAKNERGKWSEVDERVALNLKYDRTVPSARAIYLGFIRG